MATRAMNEVAMVAHEVVPEGWTGHWYCVENEKAALLVARGTEVHFSIDPKFKKRILSKKALREILAPVMERLGFVTTKIPVECPEDMRFVSRVGFIETWRDEEFVYYMLTKYPFTRMNKNAATI